MKKRIIAVFLAALMILALPSFAASTGLDVTYNIRYNQITVKGTVTSPVTLLIYPDGGDTSVITNDAPPYGILQIDAHKSKYIVEKIQLDSSVKDEYVSVDIISGRGSDKIRLELLSTAYKNGVLTAVNNGLKGDDSSDLQSAFKTYADYLHIDVSDAEGAYGDYISDLMYNRKDKEAYADITDFDDDFKEFELRHSLLSKTTVDELNSFVLTNAKTLGIETEKYYDDATEDTENTKLSDAEKEELLSILKSNTESDDFSEIFAESSALAIIRKADRFTAISDLLNNSDYDTVLNLDKSEVTDIDQVAAKMMDKEFNTFSDIETNFNSAVSEVNGDTGETEEQYQGGGGGGGGGSRDNVDKKPETTVVGGGAMTVADANFTDLEKSHWAYKYVNDLYKEAIISGYTDGSFRPENTITRAEFMKIVNSKFNYVNKSTAKIPDLDESKWYANDVRIAVNMGYIKGDSNGNVNPEGNITRAEISVAVGRLLNLWSDNELSFKDKDDVQSWAKNYISALYENKIISGYEDFTIRANNNMTRAEVSVLLSKAFELAGGVK